MKRKTFLMILSLAMPIIFLIMTSLFLKKESPVTINLWHNYGGQMKNLMDEMIDEFNTTVGSKEGIFINVTSISGSETLHEKLTMAANGDPGAPALPDITTAYPKTAQLLAEKDLLVNLDTLFEPKELEAYIPRFLEEGRLKDGGLYVFPTAKSTEVLFINMTIFNRFAKENDINLEDLNTFEGIRKAAERYYEWTDTQTPDVPNDGKAFFYSDSLFNYTMIGCKQLGYDFLSKNRIDLENPIVQKVMDSYFLPATQGYYAIFDGYASDLAKTGDIVCSTGSTAGVVFLSPSVTYEDNTMEPAQFAILPYPVFEGGKKIALQRGAGMCITKSEKKREEMAGIFLKWFTSPENNLKFVTSSGYMPVTEEAFEIIMLDESKQVQDPNIKNLLPVTRDMQKHYEFHIAPLVPGIDEMESDFKKNFNKSAIEARESYFNAK